MELVEFHRTLNKAAISLEVTLFLCGLIYYFSNVFISLCDITPSLYDTNLPRDPLDFNII